MTDLVRTDLQNFLDALYRQPAIDLVIDAQPIRSLLHTAIAVLDRQEQTIEELELTIRLLRNEVQEADES